MSKLPEPPPLDDFRPDEHRLKTGTLVWRIYARGGEHPSEWNAFRAYGPTKARFDHHEPPPRAQERRIYYAALDGFTCAAEYFQKGRRLNRRRGSPWLVGFHVARELVLLGLTRLWPTRVGASMAINSAQHARCRRWSRAIYEAYPKLDGLYYSSSMHANKPTLALYERADDALPERPLFHRALADPVLNDALANAAEALGYDLL